MPDARVALLEIIDAFCADRLSVQDFCERYETTFNLEINKEELDPHARIAFQELFDVVIWYSPYPQDRREYHGYEDEQAVKKAVLRARNQLS
jgi:hypothetical protein